jgi:hypothetical protein
VLVLGGEVCSLFCMTPSPDEELVYSRAFIDSLEARVCAAEKRAMDADERRAALEVLLTEAREVAVAKRNEYVNGDAGECGRAGDPLPWEVEADGEMISEVSVAIAVDSVWEAVEDEL